MSAVRYRKCGSMLSRDIKQSSPRCINATTPTPHSITSEGIAIAGRHTLPATGTYASGATRAMISMTHPVIAP